jgi:protein LSM14
MFWTRQLNSAVTHSHICVSGSRISLLSKKNIRYEGTLFSINEADATVALQNVKSLGTEGREKSDPSGTYVPPQDAIHPYLVFRGSDIKDLHVHEKAPDPPLPPIPPAPEPIALPDPADLPDPSDLPPPEDIPAPPRPPAPEKPVLDGALEPEETKNDPKLRSKRQPRPRKANTNAQLQQHAIGTGASLLTRKERGARNMNSLPTPADDFDFESNLANFEKEISDDNDDNEICNNTPFESVAYEKDDFFDSISCDATDKEKGVDNRLRGVHERNLNTETFGAVALNGNRRFNGRGRGGGRGGNGRGRWEGRGDGRGRGRGRGRGNGRGRSRFHGDGNLPPVSAS